MNLLAILVLIFITPPIDVLAAKPLSGIDALNASEFQRRATQKQALTSAVTAPPALQAADFSAGKAGRPPVPPMPTSINGLNDVQANIFSSLKLLLPAISTPTTCANAFEEMTKFISTGFTHKNRSDDIAANPELQAAFLAVAYAAPSREQLQQALTSEQFNKAEDEGKKFYFTLTRSAWTPLKIEENPTLKNQYVNARDRYANYHDIALSLAGQEARTEFQKASSASERMNPYEVPNTASGTATHFTSLVKSLQKADKAGIFDQNQAAVLDLQKALDKLDLPAISSMLSPEGQTLLKEFATTAQNIAQKSAEQVVADRIKKRSDEILSFVAGKEPAADELHEMARELAEALYAQPTDLSTTEKKIFNPKFFAQPGNIQLLSAYLMRMNVLLTQALSTPTSNLLSSTTESYFLPILWLPSEFFDGIKAQLTHNTLSNHDRDTFINVMATLLTTLNANSVTFGIKKSYGTNTIESLTKQTNDLAIGSATEQAVYNQIAQYNNFIKAIVLEIAAKNNITFALSAAPVTDDGKKVSFSDVLASNSTLFSSNMSPIEAYSIVIGAFNKVLSGNRDLIVGNAKMYTCLLSQETAIEPETIPVSIQKTLKPADVMATNLFFILQKGIRTQIEATTKVRFATTKQTLIEQEILTPFYLLLFALYQPSTAADFTLKTDLFTSDKTLANLAKQLSAFSVVLNQDDRPNIAQTIQNSAIVRSALYIPAFLNIPRDFFTNARAISDEKMRYSISQDGYRAIDKLLAIENGNTTLIQPLTALRDLFKQIGTNESELALLRTLKENTTAITAATQKIDTLSGTDQQTLVDAFTTDAIQVTKMLDDNQSRTFIGFNWEANALFFNEDGFFIKTIPTGLDSEARKATQSLLEVIRNNPKDLNYAERPDFEEIRTQINDLTNKLNRDIKAAAEALPEKAKNLNTILAASFLNLKGLKTYDQGAMSIYAQLKEQDNRKLIGDHKELYNTFFSPAGIFCLPDGVDISKPDQTQFDGITIQAGLSLFECMKKNDDDLGYKKDDLVKNLIAKGHAFFQALNAQTTTAKPSADGQAAPTQAEAKAQVEETTNALKTSATIDGSDAAAAKQLMTYVQQYAADLLNKKKIGNFCASVAKQVDTKKERAAVNANPEVRNFLFSAQGLFPDTTTQFKFSYIPPDGLDQALNLYNMLKDNANEFGVTSKTAAVDPFLKGVNDILEVLNKLKEMSDDPSVNYEDVESYVFITPDPTTKKTQGYIPIDLQIMIGNDDPVKDIGPQITEASLRDNGWTTKQISIYNYIYKEGYKKTHSDSTANFYAAITILDGMCKRLDQNESLLKKGALKRFLELRRIMDKTPLINAFRNTVLGINRLPSDIHKPQWKAQKEQMLEYYKNLSENARKYSMDSQSQARIKIIVDLFTSDPSKQLTRAQDEVYDGDVDPAASMINVNGMMLPMAGSMVTASMLNGNTGKGAQNATNNAMGMPMVSPFMMPGMGMGMMPGMSMMPGMGMGMMPGIMGGGQDVANIAQNAAQMAVMQAELTDLKIAQATGKAGTSENDVKKKKKKGKKKNSEESDDEDNEEDEPTEEELENMNIDYDDKSENITDENARVKGYMKFFNAGAYWLSKPDKIGLFCEKALELLGNTTKLKAIRQKIWNTIIPAVIDNITTTDRTKIKGPGPLHTVIFSAKGLLPPADKIAQNIDSENLKKAITLYSWLNDKSNWGNIGISNSLHIQNKIAQILKALKAQSTDSIDGDQDPSGVVDDEARIARYIKFFKTAPQYLADASLIGDFCAKARSILSGTNKAIALSEKIWNTFTPEIINALNTTDRTKIKEPGDLHSAIFSTEGLLPDIKNKPESIVSGMEATQLQSAIQLYQYIVDNPTNLGISDNENAQMRATAILKYLQKADRDTKYLTENSKDLQSPAKIGTYCTRALSILKEHTLGILDRNRNRRKKDVEFRTAVFSAEGLLPETLAIDIPTDGLAKALLLYAYIKNHPKKLGIIDDATIQSKAASLLDSLTRQKNVKAATLELKAKMNSVVSTVSVPAVPTFSRDKIMAQTTPTAMSNTTSTSKPLAPAIVPHAAAPAA